MVTAPRGVAHVVGVVLVVGTASAAGIGAGMSLSARADVPSSRSGAAAPAGPGTAPTGVRAAVIQYAAIAATMHRAHRAAAAGDVRTALAEAGAAAGAMSGFMSSHTASPATMAPTIALASAIGLEIQGERARAMCGDCSTATQLAAREHDWFVRFRRSFTPLARRYLGPAYTVAAF